MPARLRAHRRKLVDPMIAEPGGVCLSAAAYEQVRGKIEIAVAHMGEQDLKNIARPLRTYRVIL
jgi:class 3 adenylate cyclase